ncbi:MAG: hypothetical protein ACK502_03445 [Alphaproteobacteria bacterium]
MVPNYIPDEESQAAIRENIRAKTYESALPAIEKGVDDAVSNVRDNIIEVDGVKKDGGFWGFLKSMIFKLAKMFNFEKTLAKWFGSPIPEKEEQRAAAAQVADTVSTALTDPKFEYENKQQFEAKLSKRIKDDLIAKREQLKATNDKNSMASFSDEQFEVIASKAAKSASDKLSEMGHFGDDGSVKGQNMYLSPVDTIAKEKVKGSLAALPDADKEKLAQLTSAKEFGDTQIDVLSNVIGPKMAELEGRKDDLKAQGSLAYSNVSGEIRAALIKNKAYINDAGGMNMDDNRLTILADQISTSFVKDSNGLGVTAAPTQEFSVASATRKRSFIRSTVQSELDKSLSQISADSIESEIRASANEQAGGVVIGWLTRGILAPSANEQAKLATFLHDNANATINEEVNRSFDNNERTFDKERIIKSMEAKFDAGLADGSVPASWKEHADSVKANIRKTIDEKLSPQIPQLNQALAAAADSAPPMPAQPPLIEGFAMDTRYNARDGSLVGAPGSSPAGDRGATTPVRTNGLA